MKVIFLGLVCLGWSLTACAQAGSAAEETVQQFGIAFQNKQMDKIQPLLSDSFSIGIFQQPMAGNMLGEIIKKYFALDSLQIMGMNSMSGYQVVTVKYFFQGQAPFVSTVTLDKENKLVYARLFDQLYGVDRDAPVRLVAEIPFQLVNDNIIIDLKLNRSTRVLHMLFDTGADGMGLRRDIAESIGLTGSYEKSASVVGTNARIAISTNNTIHIDTLAIPGQNIALFDKVADGIDGLFGGNLIRRYITQVDFDRQVITLYNFGKFNYEGKGSALPADFSSGIPEIRAEISLSNGKTISEKFNFDTGAGYNLIIFGPLVRRDSLWDNFPVEFYSENHSLGHTSKIMTGDIQEMQLGDYALYHFPASIQQYRPGDEQWAQSGGSVGIHLLKKFNFTIDLLGKTIYMEPNRLFDRPFDFILGGCYLGFSAHDELIVKGTIPGSKAALSNMMVGDRILRINSMPGVMLKQKDAQTHLRSSAEEYYTFEVQRGEHEREVAVPVKPEDRRR